MQSATDTARIQLEYTLDTDDAQSQDNCTKMTTSAALLHSTEDGKVLCNLEENHGGWRSRYHCLRNWVAQDRLNHTLWSLDKGVSVGD